MSSNVVNKAVENVVEEMVDESKIRGNSIAEYLSPFGVITTKEFIYRLFSSIGLLILIGFTSLGISTLDSLTTGGSNLSEEKAATVIAVSVALVAISVVLLVWFFFATITKDYRTYGMPMPFVFSLLTPFLPFLIIIKFFISSKVERRINQAIALKQREFRESAKAQAKRDAIPDRD
jgi:hypothetical protein